MNLKFLKNANGQSLLEITIALGIMVVVIGALTVAIITGLKNSQFSQNQLQATKLAQGGIEFIKSVRDRNNIICIGSPGIQTNYYWDQADTTKTPTVWGLTFNSTPFYLIVSADDDSCQISDNSTKKEVIQNFTRAVIVSRIDDSRIKFSVNVSWSDSSGTHQSQVITILTNH